MSTGDGPRALPRRTLLRGAVTTGLITLAGCGPEGASTSFQAAQESGTIKVGFADEAPYGFLDETGRLTGEAPEVARAVLRTFGITKLEGVLADFRQLIPGLKAGSYAFVAAGMFINPTRCADAAFSIPDYQVKSAFLVPRGNPKGITRFGDIKGEDVLIAVLTGAVELGYAVEAGVPEEQIVTLGDQDSIFRAVRDGRVYGAATLDTTVAWLLEQNPGSGLEKTKPFLRGDTPGIGAFTFPKGATDFVTAFNTELRKLKESGEWLRIVKSFGFSERNVPPPDVTTEQLCGDA
ncbi:MAG: ectoine/hydroxyectoine ABC transporter substrate-binding protein EhuB [Actinophytocola sp.]|nr:ectoine/hydroxyectoine ABC transporter substrate-binding protein EhuB [Actinophytocola sp.]